MADKWLSPEEVCEIVPGMTPGLLAQMRFRGDGPTFSKPSPRKVIYRSSVIDEWLASREQTSTRENATA